MNSLIGLFRFDSNLLYPKVCYVRVWAFLFNQLYMDVQKINGKVCLRVQVGAYKNPYGVIFMRKIP